jgi:glycosyltransferase involved in cell wall biosynthesis
MPLVVTVLDLAVLRHPGMFNQWSRRYSRFAVPRVVQAAAAVITISEFTKQEVIELLGTAPGKVHAIPIAVEEPFTPDGPRAEGDYVLSVGTLEPRKNLARVVEAAQRVGVELRVVGAEGWGGVKVEGWVGRVSDDELAALYRGARCVVYPSLYEGFGLPVLEAMACGAPVVTSRGGATEEVAGGAAVLVDPLDTAAIAAGIEEALARSDELRMKGLERAQAFSWDRVARETLAVYEGVA